MQVNITKIISRIFIGLGIILGLLATIAIIFIVNLAFNHRANIKAISLFQDTINSTNFIRAATSCPPPFPQAAFEIRDANEIRALIENIKFTWYIPDGRCACHGDFNIYFYKDDNLLATISYHHKKTLRWKNWSSDMPLTKQSSEYLYNWISKHIPKETLDAIYPASN